MFEPSRPAPGPAPQGPEIRTGFLENEQPVLLEQGQEVAITTDYDVKGNKGLIAMRCAALLLFLTGYLNEILIKGITERLIESVSGLPRQGQQGAHCREVCWRASYLRKSPPFLIVGRLI